MTPNAFTDKDKENLVDFLNFINDKTTYKDLNTKDVIKVFGLLAWMQKELLPKIDANIFEIKARRDNPPPTPEPEPEPAKTKAPAKGGKKGKK